MSAATSGLAKPVPEEASPRESGRIPADRRRGRPAPRPNWAVGETTPKDTTNLGSNILRALRQGVRGSAIVGILAPSRLGDGTLTDEAAAQADRDFEKWQADNSEAPDAPPQVTGFRKLPNGKPGFEFYPPAEPTPLNPYTMPVELPEIDLDTIPNPQPSAIPSPDPARIPASPARQPGAAPTRINRPKARPAPGTEVQFEFRPDGKMRVRPRKQLARWERRRRDSKMKRWYVVALRAINQTWGTVDEARQLAEAVAWNTYTQDGRLAMNDAGRSQLRVFQGIGEGKYEVDITGALADHAINQAMDAAIGISSRFAYHGTRPIGLQSGPWDTAQMRTERQLNFTEEDE